MKKDTIVIISIVGFVFLVGFLLILIKQNGGSSSDVSNKENYLGVVDNRIGINRVDYEKKVSQKIHFLNWSKQKNIQTALIRKEILQNMIDSALIKNFAVKKNISISSDEIETRYQFILRREAKEGKNIGEELQTMYNESVEDYKKSLEEDLLKEKITQEISMPFTEWLQYERTHTSIALY